MIAVLQKGFALEGIYNVLMVPPRVKNLNPSYYNFVNSLLDILFSLPFLNVLYIKSLFHKLYILIYNNIRMYFVVFIFLSDLIRRS